MTVLRPSLIQANRQIGNLRITLSSVAAPNHQREANPSRGPPSTQECTQADNCNDLLYGPLIRPYIMLNGQIQSRYPFASRTQV